MKWPSFKSKYPTRQNLMTIQSNYLNLVQTSRSEPGLIVGLKCDLEMVSFSSYDFLCASRFLLFAFIDPNLNAI